MAGQSHLIIYSQDVHNVDPDVDDVGPQVEGQIELVVVTKRKFYN